MAFWPRSWTTNHLQLCLTNSTHPQNGAFTRSSFGGRSDGKSVPTSAFRTPWRHFIEFMAHTHKVQLKMPPSSRDTYKRTQIPSTVIQAIQDLVDTHHYTPKLIASCRWEYFTRDNGRNRWEMKHPDFPGERWYPNGESVMTLFEWSSSHQPASVTPLFAVKPDSEVPFTASSIRKLMRQYKR